MEDANVKTHEIVQLTEKFAKAIEDLDNQIVEQIVSNDLKIERNIVGKRFVKNYEKGNLKEIFIFPSVWETNPHLYIYRNNAKVVYEINTHWHLAESAFQSGFIRQIYSYKKNENDWKLYNLKTEFRRFSRYNLKESLNGLIVWLMVKTRREN